MRLIDADKLIERLQKEFDQEECYPIGFVEEYIYNSPEEAREVTITGDREEGKWIINEAENRRAPFLNAKCSICNKHNVIGTPKFCSNCGAKMVEAQT